MNKPQLIEILQTCLLYYEGENSQSLMLWMTPENVKTGIKLKKFLEQELK